MATRIVCLQVPLFPLAARLRSDPDLRDGALAILTGPGPAARVVAASRIARRAGIQPGLTLTQARTRLPKLIGRPRDPECERAAQEALLDVAESFSPRVEDAGEGLAYLDADGLERHHGSEEELAHDLILAVEARTSMPVRAGVAASKLAARLAAERNPAPTVVKAGAELSFLAPLPIGRLTASGRTTEQLQRWGIRTVGELAALPSAEVVSRLGEPGQELQTLARGEDPRPLVPRQPPPNFCEGMELEWPLVQLEPFLFVAQAALERLTERLAVHALGCERLEISLDLEPDGHHARSITLPAPSRDVKTLVELLRLDLEANPPNGPILAFRIIVHPDRPREAQLSLFGPAALSPEKLATTLAKLFSVLGEGRVGSPRTVDGHRPERYSLERYAPPPPPTKSQPPRRGRGLLGVRVLRPPLDVEVLTTGYGENRPTEIRAVAREETARRPRVEGRVLVASGPWCLEEGWWMEEPVERDYWDVELNGGGLFRLYQDRRNHEWFVDGIYD